MGVGVGVDGVPLIAETPTIPQQHRKTKEATAKIIGCFFDLAFGVFVADVLGGCRSRPQ